VHWQSDALTTRLDLIQNKADKFTYEEAETHDLFMFIVRDRMAPIAHTIIRVLQGAINPRKLFYDETCAKICSLKTPLKVFY
jgi:hypothetical protein